MGQLDAATPNSVYGRKMLVVMSDLFFSAAISDGAKKLGLGIQFVQDRAVALERINAGPALVIFDLNCAPADPIGLIRSLKADPATAGIPTIGFVSHVQTELRQRAVESGCDVVVARSVFAQNLMSILQSSGVVAHEP